MLRDENAARRSKGVLNTSAGLDLVKVGLIFYMMRIDIWPDDRAVSLWLGRARVQTLFQTSTNKGSVPRYCATLRPRASKLAKDSPMITGTVKFYNDQKGFGF